MTDPRSDAANARRDSYREGSNRRDERLVFSMRAGSTTDAHHVALVTNVDPLVANVPALRAIAGNTSEDGKSDNGDGVYEHAISPASKLFARLP